MPTAAEILKLQQDQEAWQKKQAEAAKAPPPAEESSMIPNWMKVIGSGIEQGGTAIAGLPAMAGDTINQYLELLPPSARGPAIKAMLVVNPSLGVLKGAADNGAPTNVEMDNYLREKGLQHTPANYGEDLAQNAISAAVQGAATGGTGWWNMLRSGAEQIIPATVGKVVGDNLDSPTGGVIASMIAALTQHSIKHVSTPEASVARAVGEDVGDSQIADFREYNRLKVPAIAADVIPSTSETAAELADAVHNYPKKAAGLTTVLQDRAANAGRRIQGMFENANGTTMTAREAENFIKDALTRRTQASLEAIAASQKDSNHAGAIALTAKYLNGEISNVPSPLQKIMSEVRNRLVFKEGESQVNRPNYSTSAAYSARTYIDKVLKDHPEYADSLKPIRDNLTEGMSYSHPELKDLDAITSAKQAQLDALEAGRRFAKGGRQEDVLSFRKALEEQPNGADLVKAFDIGHADKLIENVQNTPVTGKAVTPINTRGQGAELSGIYGPDAAQRRDFEITADKTKQQYDLQPAKPKGIVEAIRHAPGFGFGALSAAGGLGSLALGVAGAGGAIPVGALAGASGIVSLIKLVRDPKLAKAYIKAAGIDNADELVNFIKKGDIGTYKGAATKSGIISLINGAR